MKKLLLVIAITFLGFVNTNAQSIQFGAKAGLNFASISGDNTDGTDTVTGFNFGVMSEISITDKFSFQPEIMFSGQGFGFGKDTDDLMALNYLNVPLIGKYYVTKGLSLEAGPQIGFLLSAKKGKNDFKDSYKNLDYGVNFGIGYKLDNGLNFSARYNVGLSNINDVGNISNKNGAFQFSIGYFFL